MQKGDWASWVQAVFSVLAILAAILLAWWQRRGERLAASQHKKVRGEIAGSNALMKVQKMLVILRQLNSSIPLFQSGRPIADTLRMAGDHALPSEDELIAISDWDARSAYLLLVGQNMTEAAFATLRVFAEAASVEDLRPVHDLLKSPIAAMGEAEARLRRLVPKELQP